MGISTFCLEQLSTICWAISICGQPTIGQSMREYVALFDAIVANTWQIIDCRLEYDAQFYLNILSALLSFKSVIVDKRENEELGSKVIAFVIHLSNQFCISDNGKRAMKNDPKIIEFLLHTAAEFRIDVLLSLQEENKQNDTEMNVIPNQMMKQIDKMLQCLRESETEIGYECAFSIVCTLSRFPF